MGGVVHTQALCVARCRRVLCRAIVRQRLVVRSPIRIVASPVAALAGCVELEATSCGCLSGCCTVPTKKMV